MSGGAATAGFPEDGSPIGDPLEMSEEEFAELAASLGPAGVDFAIAGGRFVVVPDHGHLVDLAAVVAIEPGLEGFAEFLLQSGDSVRLPIDARDVLKAIFEAPPQPTVEHPEGES